MNIAILIRYLLFNLQTRILLYFLILTINLLILKEKQLLFEIISKEFCLILLSISSWYLDETRSKFFLITFTLSFIPFSTAFYFIYIMTLFWSLLKLWNLARLLLNDLIRCCIFEYFSNLRVNKNYILQWLDFTWIIRASYSIHLFIHFNTILHNFIIILFNFTFFLLTCFI